MACIGIQPMNGDSEMEEGEIVDEVDELSDISSEEEFLLRQRLEVLENYNNVLERKQAKKTSRTPNPVKRQKTENNVVYDLSELTEVDLEDTHIHKSHVCLKKAEPAKPHKRKKTIKEANPVLKKIKDCKKKTKQNKKKSTIKVHIKSSDDSEDEYLNKRRRLADAVTLKQNKIDTSTLKDRINRMLFGTKAKTSSNIIQIKQCNTLSSNLRVHRDIQNIQNNNKSINQTDMQVAVENFDLEQIDKPSVPEMELVNVKPDDSVVEPKINVIKESTTTALKDSINLCTDNESSQDVIDSVKKDDVVNNKEKDDMVNNNEEKDDVVNNNEVKNHHGIDESSDEDLELLREYALKTKSSKSKTNTLDEKITNSNESKPAVASEDEDSDTAELRLICLKSALLKKAIEMKQKQKLKKRLSQSSCLPDDFTSKEEIMNAQSENNTDIESVDMDIGSDGEEKAKENLSTIKFDSKLSNNISKDKNIIQEDELEEDEDLLRAKLLTSLSKNLPNLVDLGMFNTPNESIIMTNNVNKDKGSSIPVLPEEKKIIIKLGESDSEGEHEATKNLTKMHMKLAEHYQDFQSKLDQLLKSTRKEFEKDPLPDVVQNPITQKPAEKFVPKAMNHLPKSEQIEYKNLVKRMAELEKIKQARNSSAILQNKTQVKDTLKPRNVSLNTLKITSNMDEKIALSRKKIAEESAKILKLKDEAKKLQQKYKIVATELKNIGTAINLNKKHQRAVHNSLQQIRLQHQLLLKGSTHILNTRNPSNKLPLLNKIQKENNPTSEASTYTNLLKSVKVSFINDGNKDAVPSRLSVQLDVANNKKTIKLPKSPPKGRVVDIVPNTGSDTLPKTIERVPDLFHPTAEMDSRDYQESNKTDVNTTLAVDYSSNTHMDDYKSPLEALGNTTWKEDPNAFLCPYEVGGSCRDPECKYLHPKIQSHQ